MGSHTYVSQATSCVLSGCYVPCTDGYWEGALGWSYWTMLWGLT